MIRPFTISLRLKISASFFVLSAAVSVLLSLMSYQLLADSLTIELRERLKNIASLGAASIDKSAFAELSKRAAADPSEADAQKIEQSRNYRIISDQLNHIRNTAPSLIRFVYTFRPSRDAGKALYVVDADALKDIEKKRKGEEHQEISHFASEYDIAEFPEAQLALSKGEVIVEKEFRYDAPYDVYSVTGYAPILSPGGQYLGTLCVDMADTDVRAALTRARNIAIAVGLGALLVSLVIAFLIGSFLTRAILSLDSVVRRFGDRDFTVRSDVRTHDEVGNLSVNFNNMAQIIQDYSARLESLLSAYGKFVPQDLLKLLQKESILDVKLGDQVARDMTVLFSDIRSFTTLSEVMTPAQSFAFINSYLTRVGPVIRQKGGFIDKYIGDAIMALFPGGPADGIEAAIEMFRRVEEYNVGRNRAGYAPVSIGVGIHTGKLMLGTVGEEERMDGTVISDTVNLASRLEGLTKVYGARIITTSQTLDQTDRRYSVRFIDRVQVKGKELSVDIFEVLDAELEYTRKIKLETLTVWNQAVQEYQSRNFELALRIFQEILRQNSADGAAVLYIERCNAYLKTGVPPDWTSVERISEK